MRRTQCIVHACCLNEGKAGGEETSADFLSNPSGDVIRKTDVASLLSTKSSVSIRGNMLGRLAPVAFLAAAGLVAAGLASAMNVTATGIQKAALP